MNSSATMHSDVNLASTRSKAIRKRESIFKGKNQSTNWYDPSKWMLSASVCLHVILPWDNWESLVMPAVKPQELCILACEDITWLFKLVMRSNFMTTQKKYEYIRNCFALYIAGHSNLYSVIEKIHIYTYMYINIKRILPKPTFLLYCFGISLVMLYIWTD